MPQPLQSLDLQSNRLQKKRKHDESEDPQANSKKKKTAKVLPGIGDALDVQTQTEASFTRFDSHLLSDYVARRTKEWEPKSSTVELEDRLLPGNSESQHENLS